MLILGVQAFCGPPVSLQWVHKGECRLISFVLAGYAAQLALAPCVVALIALLVITVGIGAS